MSTNIFSEAIKQAEAESLSNRRKIQSTTRIKRVTKHIRVGTKTYDGLKVLAVENKTTISKTADKVFTDAKLHLSK